MTTAMQRMVALNTSWPLPERAWLISPAKAASRLAPASPAAMPPMIAFVRPAMPWVAGQHDADDQAGFQHLAEHDDQACQHGRYSLAVTVPVARSGW